MLLERNSFDNLIKYLKKSEILILIGARQVGKTHLMIELEKFAKAKKKKSKKYFLFDKGIRNSIISNFSLLMKILVGS